MMVGISNIERPSQKPLNPMWGETFEYETPHFKYFAEQVVHHPPTSAYVLQGKKNEYEI